MALSLSYHHKPIFSLEEALISKLKFILLDTLDHNLSSNSNCQTVEFEQLRSKLKQSRIQQKDLIQAIQVIFVFSKGSSKKQQKLTGNNQEEDYSVLQSLIQKQQAINRNHIKIQHQMQLYLQSLQERINQLEDKLKTETIKNKLLSQKNKMIQQQINTMKTYKSKRSIKQKTIMDKIVARAQKISNQKIQNKLFSRQSRAKRQDNLVKNQGRSKIWLHDRNIRKKHVSQEASLKNLSNSVQAVAQQRRKMAYFSQNKVMQHLKVRKIIQRSSFSHLS